MRTFMLSISLIFLSHMMVFSQDDAASELPYYQIPEAPEAYTAGTVISRMIDGLGFRYYWASEGLTDNELNYEPGNDGRTAGQTMDHILGLSNVILNAAKKLVNDRTIPQEKIVSFKDKRKQILHNLKEASEIFKNTDDLSAHKVIFKNDKGSSEFPFWNNINGPLEDAIWHTGQLVVLRRSAGNPIPSGVNVFIGKKMN